MPGLDGPEQYVHIRCVLGHMIVFPAFAVKSADMSAS